MEDIVQNYIMTEKALQKRRRIRSDGALYALLLLCVFTVIFLGNLACAAWDWPYVAVQVPLYVLLAAGGYLLYRYCLTEFSYVLTDRMLTVDRVIGRKTKPDVQIHLCDIRAIYPYEKAAAMDGKIFALYTGKRKDTVAVIYDTHMKQKRGILLLSISKAFQQKLVEQWKKAR